MNTTDAKKLEEIKRKLDEQGFTADTFADRSKRTYNAIGIFQIGLNLFAFIALLAASFGIINTLVIAVMEPRRKSDSKRLWEWDAQRCFFFSRWNLF